VNRRRGEGSAKPPSPVALGRRDDIRSFPSRQGSGSKVSAVECDEVEIAEKEFTMNATTTTTKITIALSDAPPVRVSPETWPVVARADWHSGEHECQANEVAAIRVREHTSGRRIVYGWIESGPGGMPIGYRKRYAGFMVDHVQRSDGLWTQAANMRADETVRAIRRVAGVIALECLGAECIADLPVLDLE
jgi:hypothetical protein